MENKLELKIISSLEKVFADKDLNCDRLYTATMFANEVYSFQMAYKTDGPMQKNVKINVTSPVSDHVVIRKVDLVPSEMPCYANHDDNILSCLPGLYPDPLIEISTEGITLLPGQWRSLWITVCPSGNIPAGKYNIVLTVENNGKEIIGRESMNIEILDALLPEQELIHTQWFHTDCISTWYNVDIFSEEYWNLVSKYVKTAVDHGINMILTPVFTPPLDTVVGGERPTVQLVDIVKSKDSYSFGYEKLKKWIDICLSLGVKYFEISHFFTQWGANHAPKIIAHENGIEKKIFGWETDAGGKEYRGFLSAFIPDLIKFIKDNDLESKVYFHVSDEPSAAHFDSYKNAAQIINSLAGEFPIIDALSDYEFYEKGLVKNPIPATNHIEPFLENNIPDLFTYYCCSQYRNVANRFFCMPSARNRILGIQLYKYDIKGFLQWGYNFWYSQYSKYPIDPYKVTDAGHAFPSGDAFSVYPGKNGPVSSLKFEVFHDAIQDLRALKLLEKYVGKEKVIELLERDLPDPITFSSYPHDASWLLGKREEINRLIMKYKLI